MSNYGKEPSANGVTNEQLKADLLAEIDVLKAEVKDLRSDLIWLEGKRKVMEEQLEVLGGSEVKRAQLTDVVKLDSNRSLKGNDGDNMGLIWNHSNMWGYLEVLDGKLDN